jgi:selenocysteine lyase/cysteine desulfurase
MGNNSKLTNHFASFRKRIIGVGDKITTNYGQKDLIYADWTASGRNYLDIEERLLKDVSPMVANTHTETTTTGSAMTLAYHEARNIIKKHVGASDHDVLILEGTGMTGAIAKFQRILGLRVPEQLSKYTQVPEESRPVVFVTHMEHHSNHTSWLETIAQVELIPHTQDGLVDLEGFREMIKGYDSYETKIASVSAASNVTGIQTPFHEIAEIIHAHGGLCFVDFACSAPYVEIDMHPAKEAQGLDAIFFSPHKFLGGPGTSGVLIFNRMLYKNLVPDRPGGGTVDYTNPWGDRHYYDDIEMREDGGTPGFLQAIKTAMSIRLKEKMGVEMIKARENEINDLVFAQLEGVDDLVILANEHKDRLSIFSFYIERVHFNLVVRLLNDRFGIQTRGGCSCAGTYGHFLLEVEREKSKSIQSHIIHGDLSDRPGWIRASFHPTMTDKEVLFVCDAIKQVTENHEEWGEDYIYLPKQNEYVAKHEDHQSQEMIKRWFA